MLKRFISSLLSRAIPLILDFLMDTLAKWRQLDSRKVGKNREEAGDSGASSEKPSPEPIGKVVRESVLPAKRNEPATPLQKTQPGGSPSPKPKPDPRLEQVIKDCETLIPPQPHSKEPGQKHVSLIDGEITND